MVSPKALIVLTLVACDSGKKPSATSAGTGSGSTAPTCDLNGSYRLRYHSNGTDGWWLRFKLDGDKAQLTAKDVMDLFPDNPMTVVRDGCKATITAHTNHSGDTKLAFTLDPKANTITGEISRTKGGDDPKSGPQTVQVAGHRDVGPSMAPACIKPGVFEIKVVRTKWKLSEGHPRIGNCTEFSDMAAAKVRVDMLGDQLFIDEASGEFYEQSFARATLTKISDCEYGAALEITDFSFEGTLKFAGDTITGTAKKTRYQFFEDGEAGENLWACKTQNAPLEGKRIAD